MWPKPPGSPNSRYSVPLNSPRGVSAASCAPICSLGEYMERRYLTLREAWPPTNWSLCSTGGGSRRRTSQRFPLCSSSGRSPSNEQVGDWTDRRSTLDHLSDKAGNLLCAVQPDSAASALWICGTTAAPSPTAAATRLVEPALTSPMAKTSG